MKLLYKKNLTKYGMLTFVLLSIMSCSNLLVNLKSSGEMKLKLDASRAITSDLDTAIVSYRLEGTNGGGESFDFLTTDTTVLIPDLNPGEWQVRVRGYNGSDQVVAEGLGILIVEPGGYASMTIVLYDADGAGSLDFSLTWNSDLVWNEQVEVQFKNLNGETIPLALTRNSGFASGSVENLSAGFYTLEVKLFDNMILTMGAMELVQVREGAVTNINLDFTGINKPGQRIPVAGENFKISWNNDTGSANDEYRIYYREHGTFIWTYLGSTGSGSILEYTIDQSVLNYGVYDLAVSAVIGSEESELHTSMDDSAVPATGWYIDWSAL